MTPRTEQDLRDALDLAAADHPSAAEVLRTKKRRNLLLPIAAAAVVLLAVAIPTFLLTRHSDAKYNGPAAGIVTSASGVAHGPVNDPPTISNPVAIPGSGYASAGHTCRPDEVTLTLTWGAPTSTLEGRLTARNTSAAACDLLVKPSITAIGADGKPVSAIASMEMKTGPQRLLPGASASSTITWSGWCGGRTSGPIVVDWGTGKISVTPTGQIPTTSCAVPSASSAVSAGWFDPLS